jgi:hypothetical protein
VIPLTAEQVASFDGLDFVPEDRIEIEPDRYPALDDEFDVFGFPDSNSQFQPHRPTRNVQQASFFFGTTAAPPETVARAGFNPNSHLVLEFDPEKVTVAGQPYRPPNPRGISGGAAFHIVDGKLMLAAIMTDHPKSFRLMAGVRMSEVVAIMEHAIGDINRRRVRGLLRFGAGLFLVAFGRFIAYIIISTVL